MNGMLKEWLDKAEGDCNVALREHRARRNPNHDAVCFHAQQCIEKYLKAALAKDGISIRKIHDLVALMEDCLPRHPLWEAMRPDLEWLSQSAVKVRYPGESADKENAASAVRIMKRCRDEIAETLAVNARKSHRRASSGKGKRPHNK